MPLGPTTIDPNSLDVFGDPTGPSSAHIFGVDQIGRDVFSRVIYGARISLLVAFVSTTITTVFGVFCGLFAGYYRGWVDTVVSRTVDAWLAIPYLLLAIGLASACSFGNGCVGGLIKPGVPVVIAVIAITSWTYPARIIRGQVLSLREKEFVDASRLLGASNFRIIVKDLLPNLTAPIIVFASTFLPTAILFEAALSFLGRGSSAADTELGPDDFRCFAQHRHPVVVHAVPGARASVHRACVQLRWRRDDRCDEPADEKALTRGGSAMKVRQPKGRNMRSRSRLLGVLLPGLLAMASLGVAACGSSSKSTSSSSAATSTNSNGQSAAVSNEQAKFPPVVTAPATAVKGGTLTVIANGDVDYIDPGAAYYQPTYMIDLAADSPLMGWPPNDTAAPVPLLASGQPTITNGGKTITFHIKPNIKYSPPLGGGPGWNKPVVSQTSSTRSSARSCQASRTVM